VVPDDVSDPVEGGMAVVVMAVVVFVFVGMFMVVVVLMLVIVVMVVVMIVVVLMLMVMVVLMMMVVNVFGFLLFPVHRDLHVRAGDAALHGGLPLESHAGDPEGVEL
jgi:fatty acid desaturase